MRSNNKHSIEELERYTEMYLNDAISYRELRDNYGLLLCASTFKDKVLRYQRHGRQGIRSKLRNNHYSQAFRQSIIEKHFNEGIPIKQLARKYNIPSHKTVRSWIIKYTKRENLPDTF